MRPTLFQRLFTDNRPLLALIAVGALSMLLWTTLILFPTLNYSLASISGFFILAAIGTCLGAALGVFPGAMLLGLLLCWIERRNGAPFREGDEVVILSRRDPGRVTRIYAIWAEGIRFAWNWERRSENESRTYSHTRMSAASDGAMSDPRRTCHTSTSSGRRDLIFPRRL